MRAPFAILALLLLAACGSVPDELFDVGTEVFRTKHRADHAPWGRVAVRHVRDERPGWEYGRFNYLNESYFSEELFRLPVPATLKRLLYRELGSSGAFEPVPEPKAAHYLLDVTIHHYYLKTDRDLLTILPVLPALSTEIHVDIEVRLTDGDGRLFLAERFDSQAPERAEAIAGIGGSGADRLAGITAIFLEELIVALDRSVPRFWRELGREVPPAGGE